MVRQPDYGPSSQEVLARLSACHPAGVDYPMAQAYAGGLVVQRCIETAGTVDQQCPATGCWSSGLHDILWPLQD